MLLQSIRQDNMPSGMTPGMAPAANRERLREEASRGTRALQSRIAQEQALANSLRQAPLPQGRQAGQLYVASNPLEALASVADRGLGAMMSRQLRGDYEELGEAEQAQKRAALEYQEALTQDERDFTSGQNILDRQSREGIAAGSLGLQQALRDDALAEMETVTFHDPSGEGVVNFKRDSENNYYTIAGDEVPGEAIDSLMPFKPGTEGSRASAAADREARAAAEELRDRTKASEDLLLQDDVVTTALLNPLLEAATGKPYLDFTRAAAEYTPTLFDLEAEESLQRQLRGITLDQAAPRLEKLGVNPTDKDLSETFKTVPSVNSGPKTWIDWYEIEYIPALSAAIKRGTKPELHDQVMEEAQANLAKMKELHFKTDEEDSGFQLLGVEGQ